MSSVGSSTVIGGRATGLSKSAIVSPISTAVQPDDGADVAGRDRLDFRPAEAVELLHLHDRVVDARAVPLHQGDPLVLPDLPAITLPTAIRPT